MRFVVMTVDVFSDAEAGAHFIDLPLRFLITTFYKSNSQQIHTNKQHVTS
jgi:hypothetical protein